MTYKIIAIFLLAILTSRAAEIDTCADIYDTLHEILTSDLNDKNNFEKKEPIFSTIAAPFNNKEKDELFTELQREWQNAYEEYQGYYKLAQEDDRLKPAVSKKDQQLRAIKEAVESLCKSETKKPTPASVKNEGFDLASIEIKQWPSLGQPHGPTCGFDAAKNSKHMLNFAVGLIDENELKKRLTAPIDTEHYPLTFCRAVAKKQENLDLVEIDKILSEVYKLQPTEITVLPDPSQYNPEVLRDDQFEGIKKTVEAITTKTPVVHAFILGNMEQTGHKTGTEGHWVALVVQVTENGKIIFHFADSMNGAAKPAVDRLLKILQRDITSDEIMQKLEWLMQRTSMLLGDLNIESAIEHSKDLNKIVEEKKWKYSDVAHIWNAQFITIFKRFTTWFGIFNSADNAMNADDFFQNLWPYWQNIPAIKQSAEKIRQAIHAYTQDMFKNAITKTYATVRDRKIKTALTPIVSNILNYLQEQSGEAVNYSEKLDSLTQKNKWSYTDVSHLFTKEFNEILEWFNQFLLALGTDPNFVAAMKSPTPTGIHIFLLKMGKYWIPMAHEKTLQRKYAQELKTILDPLILNKKSIFWITVLDMQ